VVDWRINILITLVVAVGRAFEDNFLIAFSFIAPFGFGTGPRTMNKGVREADEQLLLALLQELSMGLWALLIWSN
jgi:hypothetical protein